MGPASQTTAEAALSEDFLSRADRIEAFYAGLRDTFEPGKPLWLTETADAACGGNPWASTFLDSFRYLDQLGRMSKRGVQVHVVKVIIWNEKRAKKISNLVFITEEKHGRPFLDAPMPRAYIKYLANLGLNVSVKYVRHG